MIATFFLKDMEVEKYGWYLISRIFGVPLLWLCQERRCAYPSTFTATLRGGYRRMCRKNWTGRYSLSTSFLPTWHWRGVWSWLGLKPPPDASSIHPYYYPPSSLYVFLYWMKLKAELCDMKKMLRMRQTSCDPAHWRERSATRELRAYKIIITFGNVWYTDEKLLKSG